MQQLLQKALVKIKTLEAELQQTKEQPTPAAVVKEPVVIVGCGVRLPKNINSTAKLWQLLQEKRSAVQLIPKERFDVDDIYDKDGNAPGKTNARYGTFLENDVRAFDAPFFSISPREAKCLDPLQRMVLEVVYEALENAGIPSDSIRGSRSGVYIALGNSDYISARFRSGDLDTIDLYDSTGILFGTAGGRISFSYDLTGPSYNLDAACASTILALHLAKEDLQKHTVDFAVVSSANLLLTPEMFVGLSKLGSLSSTDQCRAFANDCDGYIRGEGCGVVLVKRLSDAEAANDNIEAIIRGSAVRHNGSSNGFTAPNPEVIIEAIKETIAEAGVSVEDVAYVEAHGIGNRFTDGVEVQSIHEGYKGRTTPIYVGSVKANVGHLEAGTGMPMLFKVIEILKHKKIPAQINIKELNEDVDWDRVNVKIAREEVDCKPSNGKPLLAAINLSGYSGTNVHMIFEAPRPKKISDEVQGPYHFMLSAKDEASLKGIAQKYIDEPQSWKTRAMTELCYTLQKGRSHFEYALSILANDKDDIEKGLTDFLNGEKPGSYFVSSPSLHRSKDIAFLFTGQGAQYFGMCKGYYEHFAAFRESVDACDAILQPYLGQSIKELLWGNAEPQLIHQTKFTQPALFVVEYALSHLWMSLGVQPSVLIGHSIGEISALAVAKAMTLEDALKLVVARASLMNSLPQNEGSMASVFCPAEQILPYLQGSGVDLAAANSIKNCTISGKKEALAALLEKLKTQGIKAVPLNVSHAFHSSLMDPILEKFTAFAKQISFKQTEIAVISNISGKELSKEDLNADYFARHIREAVRFAEGVQYLKEELHTQIYLEVGPNPVLVALAKQSNNDEHALWLASARKDVQDTDHFHASLQQLYLAGISIRWENFYAGKTINRVHLPNYAWNRKVYWDDPVFRKVTDHRSLHTGNTKIKSPEPSTVNGEPVKKATRETLLAYMQIEAAKVLGLEAGQKVDVYKTYREQGFDSMMSGEFLSLMEKHIGSELKMEVIHQYNTPKELHQYLIDTYFGGGEIDTTQAITMADIMFSQEMESTHNGNWHEIQPEDGLLLRWFKKFDQKLPKVK